MDNFGIPDPHENLCGSETLAKKGGSGAVEKKEAALAPPLNCIFNEEK